MSSTTLRLVGDCEYASGTPELVDCKAPARASMPILGVETFVCLEHLPRLEALAAALAAAPAVLTEIDCPPNAAHAGTVAWCLEEQGNACPICGRFA